MYARMYGTYEKTMKEKKLKIFFFRIIILIEKTTGICMKKKFPQSFYMWVLKG